MKAACLDCTSTLADFLSQAYMGFCSSMWSFNPVVSAWEPVMEPWDLIVTMASNPNPLVTISALTPQLCVHCL